MDYRLTQDAHMDNLSRRINYIVNKMRLMGKSNLKVRKWTILFKIFVLPHYLYCCIATTTRYEFRKKPMERLECDLKKNFKRFMGLRITIADRHLIMLMEFDINKFANKNKVLTIDKWKRRRKHQTVQNVQCNKNKTIQWTNNCLSWDIISAQNIDGGRCKEHEGKLD